MDQLSKAVSWFSFRVELHRTCGLVSRQTWLPSRWISFCVFVCVCLEVKGFGSGCLNGGSLLPSDSRGLHCDGIKRPSNQQSLFLVHPFGPLLFFLLESVGVVYIKFITLFRLSGWGWGHMSIFPTLFGWSPKSGGTCFLDLDGLQSKLMVDGNVMNSWSGSKDCQNTHGLQR